MDKIYEILNRNKWYKYEHKNNHSMGKIKELYNFPHDYLEFIESNNCGEGYIGENYLYLWRHRRHRTI
jgi:hypothetical protein